MHRFGYKIGLICHFWAYNAAKWVKIRGIVYNPQILSSTDFATIIASSNTSRGGRGAYCGN